jgi:hypothetical protein
MVQLLDGTPYVGVFSFGIRWLDPHGRDGLWLATCDLMEEDFVPVQTSVPE